MTEGPIWASTRGTVARWGLGTSPQSWCSLDSTALPTESRLLRWARKHYSRFSSKGADTATVTPFFFFRSFLPVGHPVDSRGPAETWKIGDWRCQRPRPQPAGPAAPPRVCGHLQIPHREALWLLGPQQPGMEWYDGIERVKLLSTSHSTRLFFPQACKSHHNLIAHRPRSKLFPGQIDFCSVPSRCLTKMFLSYCKKSNLVCL